MSSDSKKQARAWLRRQSAFSRGYVTALTMLACLDAVVGIGMAFIIATFVASLLAHLAVRVPAYATAFALLAVARAALTMLRTALANRLSRVARRRLRGQVLAQISQHGPLFLRKHHSSEIASMIVDHIEALDGYFARFLPIKASWMVTPVIVLCAVAYIGRGAAIVLLLSAIVAVFAQAIFGIWTGVESKRQFVAMMRLQTRFVDRVRGIATLVLSGAVPHEADLLQEAGDHLRKRTMRVLRTAFLSSTATDLAAVMALVGIALLSRHSAADQALGGHSSFYHLFAVFFSLICVSEFYSSFRVKGMSYQDAAQAEAAATVLSVIPEDDHRESTSKGVAFGRVESLHLEDVWFRWRSDGPDVIKGISLSVLPGEILLVDGASGAGKSTFMELLLGFIVPQRGVIELKGSRSSAKPGEYARQDVAWIDQKPVIFAGSLRENLLFACPNATEAQLMDAIQHASLGSLLETLPLGLETIIGENGFGISGGQAQRVAVARAFLRNAPLLLLDEPTAHLDPETEDAIVAAIRDLGKGRIVILSSHSERVRAIATRTITLLRPSRGDNPINCEGVVT